jgi:hypothetical protein
MDILLMLHSILRWLIVLAGLLALVKFAAGWLGKREFSKMDRGLSSGFSGLMDLQVLLGLIYFFITGFGEAGFPMFRIEHMSTMLVAAVVAHAPSMFKKRAVNKYAVGFFAVLGALAFVLVGVTRLPGGWSR